MATVSKGEIGARDGETYRKGAGAPIPPLQRWIAGSGNGARERLKNGWGTAVSYPTAS
ncbi:MAG: hypothetical protein AAF614_21165 [Chloroflexota bacterium]